jgi:hypothetical protein
MPVHTGIHLGARFVHGSPVKNLDSGPGSSPGQALRRNGRKRSRLPVDNLSTSLKSVDGCLFRPMDASGGRTNSLFRRRIDLSFFNLLGWRELLGVAIFARAQIADTGEAVQYDVAPGG